MRKLHTMSMAVAGGVAVAAIGGAVAVAAATPTGSTPPGKPATVSPHGHRHRHCRPSKAIGSLVSETTTGGAGHGTITIKQPDGRTLTLDLTAHTKIMKFEGHGVAPVVESLSSIPNSDVLVVTGRHLYGKKPLVGHILDLGQ